MNSRKEIEDVVNQIARDTDYYSPYSTTNSIRELVNIIYDLLDELETF